MANRLPFRYIWPVLLTTAVLLGLCTSTAMVLFRQQARVGEVLRENIDSRRAAADVEENLTKLAARLNGRDDGVVEGVAQLHEQIDKHLRTIDEFADQTKEQELAKQVRESYQRYLKGWKALPPERSPERAQAVRKLVRVLESETLPRSLALENFNSRRIEESSAEHQRALLWLAWGMVVVGGLGTGAGLMLGYGAARALSRSILRLQVNVRDAAGKLGRSLPEIVLTEEGSLERLQEQMHSLVEQIEQVVQKLQQREHEILRAEQLAAVGQLAAGVAHEIRNPLTSIKLLVQAGREAGPLPPEDLEVIEREVRRMERSLKTFLDFARPPKPIREEMNVADVVERTLGLVRGRANNQHVELRFSRPGERVPYVGDLEQLQQVLVNLVLNALDAMPSGGVLEVQLKQIAGGRVELTVLDSGPGIAGEIAPRLFEPFVSSKDTGLGLGLVISRRIVEDHGGTIEGGTRPEGGAVFTIRLPAR